MSNAALKEKYDGLEIAIIGIAGKFPGSKTIDEFWENLKNGKELISFFSDDELREEGIDSRLINDPNYVKARAIIEDADKFDANFFGFFPREVEILDPQQRIFLECSWEALEDAGYNPENYKGLIGVFGGVGMNSYLFSFLNSTDKVIGPSEGYQLSIGNEKDFLTSRVSYKLNLRGPSLDVQTACSTSLVATHLACLNLINFQCDIALAGGATITFPQRSGYLYQEGMILSPDGHCRPFDENAGGTVAGNGAGIVVLKRLADAIDDGDHIYAIIKGSAYNNDGGVRVGYTAPGVNGQAEVISAAHAVANVEPETISYIETHGTGTSLGDPIEISALSQAFDVNPGDKKFCAIGSVKSNVGHLDTAAGVTGLIKTALSLYHKTLVPSINYSNPNPKIGLDKTPFYVNTGLKKWESGGSPLRAGVSSFGIGGTNAHVVLEEAPELKSSKSRDYQLVLLSARTKSGLNKFTEEIGKYFKEKDINLADAAYTLQIGRKHFTERRFIIAKTREEASEILLTLNPKKVFESSGSSDINREIVFMFSGQGSQYINMAKELYYSERSFKQAFDYCSDYLKNNLNLNLKNIIYPDQLNEETKKKINETEYTQPALFVIEYSLAKLLIAWGIKPSAMVGHSIGEYVAATLSGVMKLEDALRLVVLRGKLMQKLPKGSMISVNASESKIKPLLIDGISIAAVNSHETIALSGNNEGISEMKSILEKSGIKFRDIRTSHAFHSQMMEPVLSEFKIELEKLDLQPPVIPYQSNLTGTWIKDSEATDPSYYSKHMRYTVRFSDNISTLLGEEDKILIEVGPGNVLTTLAKNNKLSTGNIILSTMKHPKDNISDVEKILGSLGRLWLNGINIDWKNFYSLEERLRVSLPTYPFEKKRYWLNLPGIIKNTKTTDNDLLYVQNWESKSALSKHGSNEKKNYLIISRKRDTLVSNIIMQLNSENHSVVNIINENYKNKSKHGFYTKKDYRTMLEDLEKLNKLPHVIIFSAFDDFEKEASNKDNFYYEIEKVESIIALLQLLETSRYSKEIEVIFLTKNNFDILGNENIDPNQSLILGLTNVINQEFNNVECKLIDIDSGIDGKTVRIILNQTVGVSHEKVIGIRNSKKWIRKFEKLGVPLNDDNNSTLKQNGVYLITGGLGNIGFVLADYLGEKFNAKLGLLTRKFQIGGNGSNNKKEKRLKLLKEKGIDFLLLECDLNNENEVKSAIKELGNKFGKIDGVFHGAGLTGEKAFLPISQIDNSDIIEQLSTKFLGTQNLIDNLDLNSIDFIFFHSSISSVVGGNGLAVYSGVNNYLNALSSKINKVHGNKCICVDWDTWKFDDNGNTFIKSRLEKTAISPKTGLAIINTMLNKKIFETVFVSENDLVVRLNESLSHESLAKPGDTEDVSLHERPDIATPYKPAETEIEKNVLKVWQKLLGIEQIGIYDNFFDLGGNSLLGTQLVSELRQNFQVELPLQSLFDDPTISGVAKIIEREKNEKGDKLLEMKNILENIEDLPEDEVEKILSQKLNNNNGD